MAYTIPVQQYVNRYRTAVEGSLREEANRLLGHAKPRTPREKGPLEDSGEVIGPDWTGNSCTFYVGFGGTPETAEYVIPQHERIDYNHEPGRMAKWLEVTGNEDQEGMADRIADGIARRTPQ
jgi:hypothetical protein